MPGPDTMGLTAPTELSVSPGRGPRAGLCERRRHKLGKRTAVTCLTPTAASRAVRAGGRDLLQIRTLLWVPKQDLSYF